LAQLINLKHPLVKCAYALKEGFVVGMRSMPGNPCDGYFLDKAIQQVSVRTDHCPKTVIVDKWFRSINLENIQILLHVLTNEEKWFGFFEQFFLIDK